MSEVEAAHSPEIKRYAAFTRQGRGGNPAGVVLNADELDDEARLSLAARLGYSETAFVDHSDAPGHYRLRYFSPQAEVPFCGHATVATAVALSDLNGPGDFSFETLAGKITVQTRAGADGTTATLRSVATHVREVSPDALQAALQSLHWRIEDLDPRYPVRIAFAGNDHLVLAVAHHELLSELDYDYPALESLMAAQGWTTLQLVWAETELLFHARNPFPPGGVVEDPATGAAAAAFGGYLRELGILTPPAKLTIRQGAELGRPSELLVELNPTDSTVRVTGVAAEIKH
ncbi:PhzF family phenazine biosynthesis protein [Psychromicrobium lacuslunae]|uniref:Phenazine biosynthesis protein PhzF n=1 Tax=Psychromicrobium lacuslunae TaxID=1618207 RepID=A0A0D4BW30_9MICC|nr:PhzF family phenazine biosynthesis isomerase [Psychromicrobium lacuslunae]AJT40509.1 phenazine biosynthesis protein PhzF [Psychromicrobium lacuslunae]